jgi:hypothetical protein
LGIGERHTKKTQPEPNKRVRKDQVVMYPLFSCLFSFYAWFLEREIEDQAFDCMERDEGTEIAI